jgi:hypothetical protein
MKGFRVLGCGRTAQNWVCLFEELQIRGAFDT